MKAAAEILVLGTVGAKHAWTVSPAATGGSERTKSGRRFRNGAPQQCVDTGGQTLEALKTRDFSIRFSHGMKTAKMLKPA